MKYYLLKGSFKKKEVGHIKQSEDAKYTDDIWDISPNSKIPKKFRLPEIIMHNKAIPTSFINAVSIPMNRFLIISDGFLEFLKKYEIEDYQSWKIKVHHNNFELKDYQMFHLNDAKDNEYIDFKNSQFYYGKLIDVEGNWKSDYLLISNFEEFKKLQRTTMLADQRLYLLCDQLTFNLKNCTQDLFRLGYIPSSQSGYYISEKLMNALIEEKHTGMQFQEISTLKNCKVIY